MVKFRKIAFLTMAAVLLSTCATGISNLSESRVGGQYTVYAARHRLMPERVLRH